MGSGFLLILSGSLAAMAGTPVHLRIGCVVVPADTSISIFSTTSTIG
jgi:hypothetical protein